jgi:predicted ribosome quality control (RQC) complex YloA/Tae2 family protein
MSNLHALREGERCARVANYYDNNQPIEIELDPTLRPEQNAEAYYERYKKAKSGARKLREEIAEIETALRKVRLQRRRILESDGVEISTCFPDSTAKGKANQVKDGGPGLHFQSGGHRILVGRSAAENEALLRNRVRGNDLWLHTRDYPGSYVFIRTVSGKSVPLEVLLDAGNLALHYSKARNGGQAELYYTQVKYLRRPKKGKRGLVLPTHEKNLLVRRDPKRLDRLFRVRAESETGF